MQSPSHLNEKRCFLKENLNWKRFLPAVFASELQLFEFLQSHVLHFPTAVARTVHSVIMQQYAVTVSSQHDTDLHADGIYLLGLVDRSKGIFSGSPPRCTIGPRRTRCINSSMESDEYGCVRCRISPRPVSMAAVASASQLLAELRPRNVACAYAYR